MNRKESLYKLLFSIALPITLQALVQSSLTIIDQLMVGQLGELEIASIPLSNKYFAIYIFIVYALVGGSGIFISQFWAIRDNKNILKSLKPTILAGTIVGILFLLIAYLIPKQSIQVFTKDQELLSICIRMQKIYFVSAIPMFLTCVYSALLRSTHRASIPMYVGFFTVTINTILNYALIWGKFGFDAYGVYGAAMATVAARILEAIIIISISMLCSKGLKLNYIEMFKNKMGRKFINMYINAFLPLLITNLVFILADTLYSRVYGIMSAQAMASMSIVFTLQGFSIGLFSGLSSATGIIVGNKLGAKENDLAYDYSKSILTIASIFTVTISIFIVLLSKMYLNLFNISLEVHTYSKNLVYVIAIFMVFRVLNMIISQGILPSGGKTTYILKINIIGMWLIGLPTAYITAFVFKLPIYLVYFFISFEEIVRFVLGLRKVISKEWIINIVDKVEYSEDSVACSKA